MSNDKAVEIFQRVWNEKIDEETQTEIGRRFYTIFLTSNPKYRSMFGGGIDPQAAIFMRMLSMFSEQVLFWTLGQLYCVTRQSVIT